MQGGKQKTPLRARRLLQCNCQRCQGKQIRADLWKKHQQKNTEDSTIELLKCRCSKHPSGKMVRLRDWYRHRRADIKAGLAAAPDLDTEMETGEAVFTREDEDATSEHSAEDDSSTPAPDCDESESSDDLLLTGTAEYVEQRESARREMADMENDNIHISFANNYGADITSEDSAESDIEDILYSSSEEEDDGSDSRKMSIEDLLYHLDWYNTINEMTMASRKKLARFMKMWHKEVELPTIHHINSKLQRETGIEPIWYDCCTNSCMASTGQ